MMRGSVEMPDTVALDQAVDLVFHSLESCECVRIFGRVRQIFDDRSQPRKICMGPGLGSDRQSQCMVRIQLLTQSVEGAAERPDVNEYMINHRFGVAITSASAANSTWSPSQSLRFKCACRPLTTGGDRATDNTRGVFAGLRMQCTSKKAAGRLPDGVEHNGMTEVHHG